MRILFDQGTPVPLRNSLSGHEVDTVYEKGWSELANGELLQTAELAGYDVFVTTDQNLKYQQNLATRKIAIVVILTASWPKLKSHVEKLSELIVGVSAGDYEEFALLE
jgi:hypothetical protein